MGSALLDSMFQGLTQHFARKVVVKVKKESSKSDKKKPAKPEVLDGKLQQNMNIALSRVSKIPMTAIADAIQRMDLSGLGDTAATQDMVRLFLSLDCYDGTAAKKMTVRPVLHGGCLCRLCADAPCGCHLVRLLDWIQPSWTWPNHTCITSYVESVASVASWSASRSWVRCRVFALRGAP